MGEPGLDIRYDPTLWVLLDPGELDPQDWAVRTAERRWEPRPDDQAVALLSTRLYAAWEQSATVPANWRFLYLPSPDPTEPVGPIGTVAVLDRMSEDERRELAGIADELAIEPPVVSYVETPLGVALRARRFAHEEPAGRFRRRPGPVYLSYAYVWDVPRADSTVRLAVTSGDIGMLSSVEAEVDDLARSFALVDIA